MKVTIHGKELDVSSAVGEGPRNREWERYFAVVVGGQKTWFMGLLEVEAGGQRFLHGTCQWLLEIALSEAGPGRVGLNVLASTAVSFGMLGMTPRTELGSNFTLLLRADDIPPATLTKMLEMYLRVVDPPTIVSPEALKA